MQWCIVHASAVAHLIQKIWNNFHTRFLWQLVRTSNARDFCASRVEKAKTATDFCSRNPKKKIFKKTLVKFPIFEFNFMKMRIIMFQSGWLFFICSHIVHFSNYFAWTNLSTRRAIRAKNRDRSICHISRSENWKFFVSISCKILSILFFNSLSHSHCNSARVRVEIFSTIKMIHGSFEPSLECFP